MFDKKREESKEVRVGRVILNEDDFKTPVEYNGEVFYMRHLPSYERQGVEVEITRRLGGLPRESHDPNHVAMVEAGAYVQASLVKETAPDWWDSAWTCPDESCIVELYRGFLRFQAEFQQKFKRNKPEGSSEGSKS